MALLTPSSHLTASVECFRMMRSMNHRIWAHCKHSEDGEQVAAQPAAEPVPRSTKRAWRVATAQKRCTEVCRLAPTETVAGRTRRWTGLSGGFAGRNGRVAWNIRRLGGPTVAAG